MPWWLYAYLFGYGVFTFLWVRDDIREDGLRKLLFAELLSDGCMVVVALAYWLPSVRGLLGGAAPIAYVAGLAWLVITGARDVPDAWPSGESAFVQIGTGLASAVLYAIICGPLLYWGFSYAFMGATGGT